MAVIFSFFQKDIKDKLNKYFEAITQCSIEEFKRENAKSAASKMDKNIVKKDTTIVNMTNDIETITNDSNIIDLKEEANICDIHSNFKTCRKGIEVIAKLKKHAINHSGFKSKKIQKYKNKEQPSTNDMVDNLVNDLDDLIEIYGHSLFDELTCNMCKKAVNIMEKLNEHSRTHKRNHLKTVQRNMITKNKNQIKESYKEKVAIKQEIEKEKNIKIENTETRGIKVEQIDQSSSDGNKEEVAIENVVLQTRSENVSRNELYKTDKSKEEEKVTEIENPEQKSKINSTEFACLQCDYTNKFEFGLKRHVKMAR